MIEAQYTCPYCGELIDTFVDISAGDQHYIEDCSVCCRPVECHLHVGAEDDFHLEVSRDDE